MFDKRFIIFSIIAILFGSFAIFVKINTYNGMHSKPHIHIPIGSTLFTENGQIETWSCILCNEYWETIVK